jgi:hypothetical protein
MNVTIGTAAERIAYALDMHPSEALALATTYAIQCDIDTGTQEGGQAPGVQLDADTFVAVVTAAIESSPREVERRAKAIESWRTEQTLGMDDPAAQQHLELFLPELWLHRQTWTELYDEDHTAHRAANPGNPMLLQLGEQFTVDHWRPETRAARVAYDATLAGLGQ